MGYASSHQSERGYAKPSFAAVSGNTEPYYPQMHSNMMGGPRGKMMSEPRENTMGHPRDSIMSFPQGDMMSPPPGNWSMKVLKSDLARQENVELFVQLGRLWIISLHMHRLHMRTAHFLNVLCICKG